MEWFMLIAGLYCGFCWGVATIMAVIYRAGWGLHWFFLIPYVLTMPVTWPISATGIGRWFWRLGRCWRPRETGEEKTGERGG